PIERVEADTRSFLDIWASYLLATSGGAAYYCSERLLYYRAHDSSLSNGAHLSIHLASIHGRRRMLRDPNLRPHKAIIVRKLARDHVLVGAELLRRGRRREGREHLGAAVRLAPTPKALAGWTASWIAPSSLLGRL